MQAAHDQPMPEIAGYRLERRLGEGGMAEVWAATQLALERQVALKVVAADGRITPEMAARFEREARTIARLEHPHVMGIFDVGRTADGRMYYSMPLMPNGDLGRRDLRYAPREVVRVMRGVLEALAHAHAAGVIHRDVKPANILFDRADRPLLADFGIALSQTERARVTSARQTLGSSAYMSPEQARSGDVDARADLYSAGVVAFELLTGDLPFHGTDALAVALAHIEQPVPRLPAPHAAWQPFIDRALGKTPAGRFASARDMLDALAAVERALDALDETRAAAPAVVAPASLSAAGPAPEPASAASAASWAARPALLGALALVVIGGVAAAWLVRTANTPAAVEAPTAPDPAVLEALLAEGAQALDAGRLLAPDGDSAADRFLAALPSNDPRARAGLEQVMQAASAAARKQLATNDGATASETFDRAYAVAERSAIADWPAWAAFERDFAAGAGEALQRASERLDAAAVQRLSPALDRAAMSDRALFARREQLGDLPPAGTALRDPRGPVLVMVPGRGNAPAFALGRTEVTRGEYAAFADATRRPMASCRDTSGPLALFAKRTWREPGFAQTDMHPVVCVNAEDARAYAAWLSQRTGARYRLPTRAEWARAIEGQRIEPCRSGNLLDDSAATLRRAFECADGHRQTAPAASFAAGPLGLRDVVGNVAEWSGDCARRSDAGGCAARYVLGSSFRDGPAKGAASRVDDHDAEDARPDLGFRVLRELSLDDLPPRLAGGSR
jgi:serine/threonine-protein kinase PpkA